MNERGSAGATQIGAGQCRQRDRRRRRAGRRAVDDQHRHRRRERDRGAGRRAGARRLRDRAHHGRPRRSRGGGAAHQGAAAAAGLRGAARRRLPLHRPQAARRSSRLCGSTRQVPHQSRQCRLQGQEGPPVLRHRRDRDQARQAGAHRRQLGLARPGTAHAPDGREFALQRSEGRARGDARGDDPVGAVVGRARRRDRPAAQPHHPLRQGLGGAGPDRGLCGSCAALELCAASWFD